MKLSISSWSFPFLTLEEAVSVANALGFHAIDLGYFFKTSLDKEKLLFEPENYGRQIIESLPLPIANLFHLFGNDLDDRNLSAAPDPRNLADLKSALTFSKAAGVSSIFVLPGMINPGQSRKQALTNSAEALRPMVEAGHNIGVDVLVEPHIHGILESPDLVQELIGLVPGLKIVLDPSHFVAMGYRQEEIEPLFSITAHVHIRQARPGIIQTKMDDGIINFPAFFGTLRDVDYDGWLTVEYEHEAGTSSQYDDVLSESVKMRDCFNHWMKGK